VLLIAPSAIGPDGHPIKQRRLHLPALTLPLLAALTPRDVELRLVSETVEEIPYDQRWDLVGVTGMGSGIVRSWQIAATFRERGVPVVLGGICASLGDPELSLRHVDALVIGEAEQTWPRVLRDVAAGRLQRLYRAPCRPGLDSLPVPRYDLMDRSRLGFWRPVQTTRGCGNTCTFCSVRAFFDGEQRGVPIANVIRDVRAARRNGSRYIAFVDDNIGWDPDRAGALFEALIPERITWVSQCGLHIARDPRLLKLAHKSGCRLLSFGVESVNAESLRRAGKKHNRVERYAEDFRNIRAHGIDISTEMMVGLDGDDDSVFDATHAFIMKHRLSTPRVHILTPVPGTPLHEQLGREGRLEEGDFSRFTGGNIFFKPRRMDPLGLVRRYWRLYDQIYSWRAIAHRVGRNPSRLGPVLRAFIIGTNIHYRGHIRRRICPGIV
jgi:radical SAM superfamily enzyme YgiQ (UPF0313 family)